MAVSNLVKYGVVLGSSLTGAASGFAYSGRALNLRSRLEKSGKRLLRPSDPSWMYERILTGKKEQLKKLKDIVDTKKYETSTTQQNPKPEKTDLQRLKDFADSNKNTPDADEVIALSNWCQEKLTNAKYNSWNWEKDVYEFCEYPDWAKED